MLIFLLILLCDPDKEDKHHYNEDDGEHGHQADPNGRLGLLNARQVEQGRSISLCIATSHGIGRDSKQAARSSRNRSRRGIEHDVLWKGRRHRTDGVSTANHRSDGEVLLEVHDVSVRVVVDETDGQLDAQVLLLLHDAVQALSLIDAVVVGGTLLVGIVALQSTVVAVFRGAGGVHLANEQTDVGDQRTLLLEASVVAVLVALS